MSQGPLCPNVTKKVQKEVSQIANHNLSLMILLGGLSLNLNHLKPLTVVDQGSLLHYVYLTMNKFTGFGTYSKLNVSLVEFLLTIK